MTRGVVKWWVRGALLLAGILLGFNGLIIGADIFIETFIFDELGSLAVSGALLWLIEQLRKANPNMVSRGLLWAARWLLAVQGLVVALDFSITTLFLDEMANLGINGALVWIVSRLKSTMGTNTNMKGQYT